MYLILQPELRIRSLRYEILLSDCRCYEKAVLGLNVSMDLGGDWKRFKDEPYFKLTWSKYPE
mgnify:CR=1 FL=1